MQIAIGAALIAAATPVLLLIWVTMTNTPMVCR
jgi:hypothetical protein